MHEYSIERIIEFRKAGREKRKEANLYEKAKNQLKDEKSFFDKILTTEIEERMKKIRIDELIKESKIPKTYIHTAINMNIVSCYLRIQGTFFSFSPFDLFIV
jgi:hypothetical protein